MCTRALGVRSKRESLKGLIHTCALQQMTEAAVARERAKLYAEVKQNIDCQTTAVKADELASLRDKYVYALILLCICHARMPHTSRLS